MSGGIFPNRPFTLNIKCVVITLMIALGYIIIGVICTLMTLAVIKAHKEAKQNE